MNWLETFRAETAEVIEEPFFRCLAEAVAIVESGQGRHSLTTGKGLNEIGYKAIANHPSTHAQTREADSEGRLVPTGAEFRIFRDRREQAQALLWLLRSSGYYEAARLLFILAFYSAYAPGRTAGAREVIKAFNAVARSGSHAGVRPIELSEGAGSDGETLRLNHEAARQAVRLFAELTATQSVASL